MKRGPEKLLRESRKILVDAENKFKQAVDNMQNTAGKLNDYLHKAAVAAASIVEPKVRSMLLSNFRSSGIQSDTGELEKAISQTRVVPFLSKRKGWRLVLYLPKGLSDKFYTRAASLNSGAVRGMTGSTARAKRMAKTLIAKHKLIHKEVTKGFHFYELTPSQKAEISSEWESACEALVRKYIAEGK